MTRYRHTQTAWYPVIILGLVIAAVLPSAVLIDEVPTIGRVALVAFVVVMAAVLLVFRRLTVEIAAEITVFFGWGWPRRRVDPATVTAQRIVRNRWWYGWGIRWIPHGTLWNLFGLDAVELQLADGRVLRIGTDDPEGLVVAVAGVTGRA